MRTNISQNVSVKQTNKWNVRIVNKLSALCELSWKWKRKCWHEKMRRISFSRWNNVQQMRSKRLQSQTASEITKHKKLPQCIGRTMFCVVKFFEPWYGEEFFHWYTIFKQQFHKINAIMFECLHHGIIQCSVRPFLSINKDFTLCNIDSIPCQCQTQLLWWREMLRLEQRC